MVKRTFKLEGLDIGLLQLSPRRTFTYRYIQYIDTIVIDYFDPLTSISFRSKYDQSG